MYTLQTMTVNNVTFSGNSASEAGGALETVCRSLPQLISECILWMMQDNAEHTLDPALRRDTRPRYPLWTPCSPTTLSRAPAAGGQAMPLTPSSSQIAHLATTPHQPVRALPHWAGGPPSVDAWSSCVVTCTTEHVASVMCSCSVRRRSRDAGMWRRLHNQHNICRQQCSRHSWCGLPSRLNETLHTAHGTPLVTKCCYVLVGRHSRSVVQWSARGRNRVLQWTIPCI